MYLKLPPSYQQGVARGVNEKLAQQYFGPYEIIKRVGFGGVSIRFALSSTIHLVFNVSQPQKTFGDRTVSNCLTSALTDDKEVVMEPLAIVGVCRNSHVDREVWIA